MTNETTTGEIVREARRVMLDAWGCAGCDLRTVLRQAVDRLESQERKITEIENSHKEMLKDHKAQIAELTARAESAERERDAAVADFKVAEEDGLCCICAFIGNDIGQTKCVEDCCFKWRGQPQDGEGL